MSTNTIYKGKDNPVILVFAGVDLTAFTDISVTFGSDTRTLLLNPTSVIVLSQTELELNFQDTTETESNYWNVFGTNATYPDGFELTSKCMGNLPKTRICENS